MKVSRFFRSMFRQDGTIEKRLFWFIAIIAVFVELLSLVVDRINGLGINMLVIMSAAILTTLGTMAVAWGTHKYGNCYLVLCLIINLIIVPMAFIKGGGFYSGVPCFIFLGLVMCAISPNNRKRFISFGISLIGYGAMCYITLRYPDYVTSIPQETVARDQIFAILISALVIILTLAVLVGSLRSIYDMNLREYEARTRMRLELLESQADNIEEAKRQRNEMRRHNMIISEYAEKGDFDGLLEYLSIKQAGDEHYGKKIYCMNTMINSVLGIYANQAMKKKVPMEISTDVSQELPIPEPDLVSIVSNILESAINGAERSDAPERIVIVDIHTKNGKLVLNCKYSCAPGFSGQQEYNGNAGIGLEIVRRIVTANDGIMDFSVENGMAHCRLVITVGAGKKR